MAVLIAAPDDGEAQAIIEGLGAHGIACERTPSAIQALARASACEALVAEMELPDLQGLDLARRWRSQGHGRPLILLGAPCSPEHRAAGLEAGADDFVCRPFTLPELAARLRALIRRSHMPSRNRRLGVADLVWEPDQRRVSRGGKRLDLTPKEYALLTLLLERPGEVVSRGDMARALWGCSEERPEWRSPNALDAQVRRLRAKVDGPFDRPLLLTFRGQGMRLDSD
jgi:DNA-binding response OmpR family regulator